MKTILSIIKWISLGLLALLLVLIAGSSLNHVVQTAREEATYPSPGELVPVNDHRLHVYAEGDGDLTLVFMSGSGTAAPVLDFRPLYGRLADDYRTVVVERAGYGWSENGGTSRDIDTVLSETRRALTSAGESGPYVLLPHSMSALEALHWANAYPDEVTGIIGLDPAVPPVYEVMPMPRLTASVAAFTSRTGLLRLVPSICREAPVAEHLTEADMEAYCSMMVRRTMTSAMLAEVDMIQANAERVAGEGIPNVPLFFFISNGDDVPVENWGEILADYAEAAGGEYHMLDVGHFVHNEAPDLIAAESRAFLQQIER
jgi:pimeloyl-ACP methyl ester carboxylesterase